MSPQSPPARSAREAFGLPLRGRLGSSNPLGQDPSRPRRRLPLKLIIGVVSALLLVSAGLDIVPAVRAGLHDGTRGSWVATTKTCRGSACTWAGKFVTPTGRVVVPSAHYAGRIPAGARVGTSLPALFTGESGLVYPTAGSDVWIELVVTMLVGLLGLYWSTHARLFKYARERNKPA